ncbi:MAG: hydroxyacylglutathione hydrolase, partial [Bdellovibrio sp.]|nr:hydroxyacylglutathione hydrolase [Bdellovibrio sp.]
YQSLQRVKNLPSETLIYCTHEYTETNLIFCKMLTNLDNSPITGDNEDLELYENQLRSRREMALPSVPLKLSIERKVNPFLLAHSLSQFTYLRELRNKQ